MGDKIDYTIKIYDSETAKGRANMTGKMDFNFFYNEDERLGFNRALKARLSSDEPVTVKFCAPGTKVLGGHQSCAPEVEKEKLFKKQVITITADTHVDERIDKARKIMQLVDRYEDKACDRVYATLPFAGPSY